ncbi:hypothetical protein [Jidongwangia harbinensis]|uniref:hypothetical protein n=1 Tax=Jidongwangia harbinensis TaxID=2878561 RepID=UPI001CDA0AD6|nr:hypothetical protein [Jidongwangia harbinensis]MCA2218035.1 hypothetical protein [Jidongwangia harbinensis]
MTGDGLLRVSLRPDHLPPEAVLAAEVIDTRTAETTTMPMPVGGSQELRLPPGTYVVRAALSSGEIVARTADVDADALTSVTLQVVRPTGAPTKGGEAEPALRVWARLWHGTETTPLPVDAETAWAKTTEHVAEVKLNDAELIQVGGPGVAWRFVCLPPAPRCVLTLARVRARGDVDDGVRVRAWSPDPTARAMLSYLSSGQLDQAQVVAGDLEDQALRLFRDKVQRPDGAAVAGYLLLRLHRIDRLGDWPDNFARWFGWLPDAHIIHAWQLLRERGLPRGELARRRLLSAAEAGIPRYTEGLGLLLEGLRMFAGSDRHDRPVASALATVRAYASACDWSAPQTVYWGRRPDQPSLTRHEGEVAAGGVTQFWVGV